MANTIKIKNSNTSTDQPSSLEAGEIAINTADGKIFYGDGSSVNEFTASVSGDTFATDLKIGRDSTDHIFFNNNDKIGVRVANENQIEFKDGQILPVTDDNIDLGSSSYEFKDLYIDGIAYIDQARIGTLGDSINISNNTMTNVDINSGSIDGTPVGANTASTGAFTAVTVDELTINNDTITGSDDFIISAAGKDISFTDGSGTAEFIFNLEDAPELDVDGAFTIDCSSTMDIELGGDFTIKGNHETLFDDGSNGTIIEIDPVNAHFRIHDDAQTGNYFDIAVEANGATTISTVDTDAEAAHLTFDLDGDMIVDADNSDIFFKDGGNTRFGFKLDSTPEIDVTGAFKLDGGDAVEIESGSSGDITLDSANDIILDAATGVFKFYDAADTDDSFKMTVVGGTGATTLETVSASADGHITLDSDGDITLDAGTGNIFVKDNGGNYTPGSDYEIATKKYVDDNAGGGGGSGLITSSTRAATNALAIYGANNATLTSDSDLTWDSSAGKLSLLHDGTGAQLDLTNTDSGSSAAPRVSLFRNSSSVANNDTLGRIIFKGNTSSADAVYADIIGKVIEKTEGQSDGGITFRCTVNGSDGQDIMRVESGTGSVKQVVPGGNNTIALGSSSAAWKELHVNSIFASGTEGVTTTASGGTDHVDVVVGAEIIPGEFGGPDTLNLTTVQLQFTDGILTRVQT